MKTTTIKLSQLTLAVTAALWVQGCSDGTGEAEVVTELVIEAPVDTGPVRTDTPEETGWQLVWSDEFDAESVDAAKWNFETGDGSQYGLTGWGNNELQWYEQDNASIVDGKLVITAEEDSVNGFNFTSARMQTQGIFEITYGRIEASIKLPTGQGTWPAFWMLPTNSPYGGWAAGGEIDIVESTNLGVEGKNTIIGTTHFGSQWPLNQFVGKEFSPSFTVSDDFHRFAIEWEEGEIRWYIDNTMYAKQTSENYWSYYWAGQSEGFQSAENGPFNQPFHMIMNLAIGGNLPGAPNDETVFPIQMEVEYVRVYECPADTATGKGCESNINAAVDAPDPSSVFVASYDLYTDGADTLVWGEDDTTVERALNAQIGWDNGGAITMAEVDMDDRGTVIDLTTSASGNLVLAAADTETFELFGMGSAAVPWAPHLGELVFDLYVDSAATDAESQLLIKMDSGWPNLGQVALNVADLEMDAWQTVHIKVTDILNNPNNGGANPLDIDNVLNIFVIEPTAAAHVMLDNIQLKCGFPSEAGCGIRGPEQVIEAQVQPVYENGVDPVWERGIGAWDSRTGFDYFDGTNDAYKVNWAEVDDGNGGTMLQISFDDDADATGVFYIQSLSQVDMSGFSTGNITFDIRVTDYGSNTTGMAMKIDCIFPCSSGDYDLGVVGNGEWESISISIADLISAGLDITSVNTGIVIYPAPGDQAGVTFEIDNIMWAVGEPAEETPAPDLGDSLLIYNGTDTPDPAFAPNLNGVVMTEMVDDVNPDLGNVLQFEYQINETTLPFFVQPEMSTIDLSAFSEGTVTFDVMLVQEPTVGLDNTGFYIKFDSGYPSTTSSFRIDPPVLNEWRSYTINVADLLANPVPDWEQPANITQVDAAFVIAPDWGTAAGTIIRIDNIRWNM